MSITTEFRKWLPLTLITVATLLGVLFTWQFVHSTPPLRDPMQDFGE